METLLHSVGSHTAHSASLDYINGSSNSGNLESTDAISNGNHTTADATKASSAALKARKRTKTGCLSTFWLGAFTHDVADRK